MNCQTFPTGLSSGAQGGSRQQSDVVGHDQNMGAVPAGAIPYQHGMGAGSDGAPDLGQMQVHRLAVAAGQDETGALALLGQIAPKM